MPNLAPIEVHPVALSSTNGEGVLATRASFAANRGTAEVVDAGAPDHQEQRLGIQLRRLGDVAKGKRIGLLKVDVEGHELEVLRGADQLLADGKVTNLLIEDQVGYPSAVSDHLEGHGFRLYGLAQRFRGPMLTKPDRIRRTWDPPTFVATRDPEGTEARFRRSGWSALRGR